MNLFKKKETERFSFLGFLKAIFSRESKKDIVLKGQFWGLVIFVGIPLPGTGAWTGALVAALMEMRLKKAVPAIFAGVIIAGILTTIVTYGVAVFFGLN